MGVTAAIIAAAATVGGSAISANASHNASQAQVDQSQNAINAVVGQQKDALGFAKQQWQSQQQNMQPWVQYGSGALKTLGGLMGISPDTSVGQLAPAGTGAGGTLGGGGIPGTIAPPTSPHANSPHGPATGVAVPRGTPPTLGGIYAGPHAGAPSPAPPPVAGARPGATPSVAETPIRYAPPPTSGQSARTVKIKWPDGSTNDVPEDQASKYQQLGAEVIT